MSLEIKPFIMNTQRTAKAETSDKKIKRIMISENCNLSSKLSEIRHQNSTELIVSIVNNVTVMVDKGIVLDDYTHLLIEAGKLNIDVSLTLGKHSELIISPGCIVIGTGNIVGNFSHLSAPIEKVFEESVNVTGFWTNDRVYPQWFGAEAYDCETPELPTGQELSDSSEAIERAAKMTCCGEVFLPRGVYFLDKPINLSCGVTIAGETGIYKDDVNGTILIAKMDYDAIQWSTSSDNKNQEEEIKEEDMRYGNYLFHINIKWGKQPKERKDWNSPTWELGFTQMCTTIKNLRIINRTAPQDEPIDRLPACVLTGAPSAFDNVIFNDFCQAVRYVDEYIDNKRVTNCTFYCDPPLYVGNLQFFAFNLGFLGDGVLFEHNAVHEGKYNKGLRLNHCGGASVNSNILNADVLINKSMAVDFSSNHMEGNKTVEIKSSQVALRSNYIWIGNQPAVRIYSDSYGNKSVVTMDGNVFLFKDTITDSSKDESLFVCDAEIAIDEFSILNISNCYRYRSGQNFGDTRTFGVQVYKIKNNSLFSELEEFNNYSYALSQSSCICGGFAVTGAPFATAVSDCQIDPIAMLNGDVKWIGETGEYSYSAQVLLDKKRGIGLSSVDFNWWVNDDGGHTASSATVEKYEKKDNDKDEDEDNGRGVLISLGKATGKYLLRLFRIRLDKTEYKYVDIPICDSQYIYDNGVSVNGFGWKNSDEKGSVIITNPQIKRFEIRQNNVNVVIVGRITPDTDSWEDGDVIYIPATSSIKIVNH